MPFLDGFMPLCSNDGMRPGRVLALDFGSKNIGLAASDELGVVVRPLPSIPNSSRRDLLRRLRATIQENAVDALVIGLPLNMDGSSGASVQAVRRMIDMLRKELRLPLFEVDERLSTVEAIEVWKAMNSRRQRRYRTVDSLAAAIILERFLEES
jgi:putative Holliday junction resolvase